MVWIDPQRQCIHEQTKNYETTTTTAAAATAATAAAATTITTTDTHPPVQRKLRKRADHRKHVAPILREYYDSAWSDEVGATGVDWDIFVMLFNKTI